MSTSFFFTPLRYCAKLPDTELTTISVVAIQKGPYRSGLFDMKSSNPPVYPFTVACMVLKERKRRKKHRK